MEVFGGGGGGGGAGGVGAGGQPEERFAEFKFGSTGVKGSLGGGGGGHGGVTGGGVIGGGIGSKVGVGVPPVGGFMSNGEPGFCVLSIWAVCYL